MSFAGLLQHRCSIYYQTNAQAASSGGTNLTWVVRTANVPCMIRGMSGSDQMKFAQRNIVVTHSIYLLDSSAQTGDRVVDAATGVTILLKSIQTQQGMGTIPTFYFWVGEEMLPGT